MKGLSIGLLAAVLLLGAHPAVAAEGPATGVRVEQPPAQANYALTVVELVRFADKNDDPEAYLVAARMLADVPGPIATQDLGGKLPQGADLKETVEKSGDLVTVKSLVSKARALAKDDDKLILKIDAVERQATSADLTQWYDPYRGCWHGYCRGWFGCWRYCW